MKKLFSTADVHRRDRFDYWHDIACKSLIDHSSKPKCRQTFEAQIERGTLADLELILFENSPMDAIRSAQHLARAENDDLFLCRQISGVLALEQEGRHASLKAGDFALLDPLLTYSKILIRIEIACTENPETSLGSSGRADAGDGCDSFIGIQPRIRLDIVFPSNAAGNPGFHDPSCERDRQGTNS